MNWYDIICEGYCFNIIILKCIMNSPANKCTNNNSNNFTIPAVNSSPIINIKNSLCLRTKASWLLLGRRELNMWSCLLSGHCGWWSGWKLTYMLFGRSGWRRGVTCMGYGWCRQGNCCWGGRLHLRRVCMWWWISAQSYIVDKPKNSPAYT